jgi:hypothetical protein
MTDEPVSRAQARREAWLRDPEHHVSDQAPCAACGAQWEADHDANTVGLSMTHKPGCAFIQELDSIGEPDLSQTADHDR